MEQSGKFRKKKINFSMVSNNIIRNPEISLKAKGLYALIQSFVTIDGFILYKGYLQKQCSEGKKAFNSAWQELKQSGYLVQYRMQDETTKQFYWEYELLDEVATTPKGDYGSNKPLPQKGYHGSGISWLGDDMEKGDDNNNTNPNNTNGNNTNQIISDVKRQIDVDTFQDADMERVNEIVLLIAEIMSMPDDASIRIARAEKPIAEVKERFKRIDKFCVEYVIQCLNDYYSEIRNIKNYLLTSLYNAPATIGSYYQNKVNHDLYG